MTTLHLLGIPHTITRPEFSHDAFTNKVRVFGPMLREQGYHVIHYGVGGAVSGATEQVDLLPEDEWRALLPFHPDPTKPGWQWHELANTGTPWYQRFNAALGIALRERVEPQDLICVTFGRGTTDALHLVSDRGAIAFECGIGYPNSYLPFRVFESYAWMHYTLGEEKRVNGNDYWWVIMNAFLLDEWQAAPTEEPYALFAGRIGAHKGMDIVWEMAKARPDVRFVFTGQGTPDKYLGLSNLEYRPPVHGRERAALYRNAFATVALSRFVEPCGHVHCESLLMGTPVLTSDFGVYPETVENGVNGYRCRTLGDCLYALDAVRSLDRDAIAAQARARWSPATIGPQYTAVIDQLLDLYGQGWFSTRTVWNAA